jgi:undecaprenyl-phosphate 4-deoxy-4-formamido-L-arabinose transferase
LNLQSEKNFSYSIVIPVFNSEASLEKLVNQLNLLMPDLCAEYEIILVDDDSRDGSWEVIRQLAEKHSSVFGINLMKNYGQHNATLCGIRQAKNEIIITMDDDMQHSPMEITKLLMKLHQGYDVIYGIPEHEQHGLLRNLASQITKLALKDSMGVEIARKVSAFRAFRTELRLAFEHYRGPFISIDVLLTWATNKFGAVTVQHAPRETGKSNYDFLRLVKHAMNMVTGFSVIPLQFASILGFGFTLFGFGILIYVIGRYLIEGTVSAGFPFLASIIAIFSGAQLFALGIIGEYLARMHFRLMDKLPYTIRTNTNNKNEQNA